MTWFFCTVCISAALLCMQAAAKNILLWENKIPKETIKQHWNDTGAKVLINERQANEFIAKYLTSWFFHLYSLLHVLPKGTLHLQCFNSCTLTSPHILWKDGGKTFPFIAGVRTPVQWILQWRTIHVIKIQRWEGSSKFRLLHVCMTCKYRAGECSSEVVFKASYLLHRITQTERSKLDQNLLAVAVGSLLFDENTLLGLSFCFHMKIN